MVSGGDWNTGTMRFWDLLLLTGLIAWAVSLFLRAVAARVHMLRQEMIARVEAALEEAEQTHAAPDPLAAQPEEVMTATMLRAGSRPSHPRPAGGNDRSRSSGRPSPRSGPKRR